jgi:hypothetical protein
MNRLPFAAAACVLLAGALLPAAADSSGVAHGLRDEIKVLRAQEKLALEQINTRYNLMKTKSLSSEIQLDELKDYLRTEREVTLKVVKDTAARKALRADYDLLIRELTGGTRGNDRLRHLLEKMRLAERSQVRAVCDAKVLALEQKIKEVHAAEKAAKAAGKQAQRKKK